MSSSPRPFCLSPTPSLSPIRFGSPRTLSPVSRPPSVLDRTQRELFLDSRPSSPADTVLEDAVPSTPLDINDSSILATPQDRNDTLFGDGATVPNTPENFNVSWVENIESTTPLATIISTPKRFVKASSTSSSSPTSSSSSSPVVVKRRRLNFPDSVHNDEDSDFRDAVDEKDSDSSSQGFASDDKENNVSPRTNDKVIRPLSREELFFTVRRSKNFTYFLAPFSPVPMLVKIKYPPREDQISTLLSHGFEYARNLNDKQRFRNISFRYELNCSIDRRRQLIQMALGRLERLVEDTQGDDRQLTRSVQRRENVRLKSLRRELIDEERDYDSHTSFDSESDTRSEASIDGQSDRIDSEISFDSIREKPKYSGHTPIRAQKAIVTKSSTVSKKTTVPQKVSASKKTPITKKSAQKKKPFSWTDISQFVKSPLAVLNRK